MKTILVQMSDRRWTMQAVHFACALARNNHTQVVLLRLMTVSYPGYLGTQFGFVAPTSQEYADIAEYAATAEDYGIELSLQQMQCLTALDALADSAEALDVDVVFAYVPESRIPYWRRFQMWKLQRRLSASQRQLFTLDKANRDTDQPLSIEVEPIDVIAAK